MNERNKKILEREAEIHKECIVIAMKNLGIKPEDILSTTDKEKELITPSANTLFINVMKCIPVSELLRD
jgi:hypothetical protein